MIHFSLLFTLLSLAFQLPLALGDGGGNGQDDSTATATATQTTGSTTTAVPAPQQAGTTGTLTGDTQCSSTMCIAATVNGSETTSSRSSFLIFFNRGFGTSMANSPMVIMWINSGNIILSQRSATGQVMPTVASNPPRAATVVQSQSLSNTDTKQSVIYGYGATDPNSASSSANLAQHLDFGNLQLDLTKQLASNSTGSSPTTTGSSGTGSSNSSSIPLLPYQQLIIAHAILCAVGFLLLLPAGALMARYLRTFITTWFKGHWILQFGIAGPVIVLGIILGIAAVHKAQANHFDDDHKRWGLALLVLYLVQSGLGSFIHFVKKADRKRRPPQNYLHAVLGIAIIGLSLYQVYTGFNDEWPATTGRPPVPKSVKVVFWVWVVLLPVSYAVGLSFLPKQYRQERAQVATRLNDDDDRDHFNLKQTSYQYQKAGY
ncbi:hypothetical protein BDZ97DRAFT_1780761 [Flammula alnicola]|nr:hypothetical protein BDZ97DRAFT_1780761 [Flammula alnicola]